MKKFIINILISGFQILMLLFFFEVLFTQIFKQSTSTNKIQYLLKENIDNVEIAFLGNSRTAYQVDCILFNKLSKKKAINLGIPKARLQDNLLELKLLLKKCKIQYLYLQIDTNLESEASRIIDYEAMPFIENEIIRNHISHYFPNYFQLYYIPYFRYANQDTYIGIREIFKSLFSENLNVKKSVKENFMLKGVNWNAFKGYKKLNEYRIKPNNKILIEIASICKKNKIRLVLYSPPLASNIDNKDYVKKIKKCYPDVVDLSNGFENKHFFDNGHLNNVGASILTQRLFLATQNQLK